MEDVELDAMQKAAAALAPLDVPARARAIAWLIDRFGGAPVSRPGSNAPSHPGRSEEFEDFADLYHAVAPATDKERAVAAAYWLKLGGVPQFQSAEINLMLKNLGHGVGNITDALGAAIKEKPSLIIQIKKSGNSRQARKIYKVTDAGDKWVINKLPQRG